MGKLHFSPPFGYEWHFYANVHSGLAGLSRRMYDGGQQYAHASDITHWNGL